MRPGGRRRPFRPWRRIRHAATIPALEAARYFARLLTHRGALRVGATLGAIAFFAARRERLLAQRQLLDTGVARTPADARRLAREVFRNLGMSLFEWLHAMRWPRERLRARVHFDGRDHLHAAGAGGRGYIIVSGHFGNWELMPRVFEAVTGTPVAAVMTDPRNTRLTRWIVRHREVCGIRIIPQGRSGMAVLRHLLKGGALGLMIDQDSRRTAGLFVPFFGRPALTPSGPAFLARRTGCALVPMTMTRDAADPTRHRFCIHPPIWPDSALDDESDIRRITETITRQLEACIRASPIHWVWFHARWKHQPGRLTEGRIANSE
jgi:KDO2-lipid IV(A) lauroyltransferase